MDDNEYNKALKAEIEQLKRERNAVILAHNYQVPEVQLVGDHLGDSLDLSRKAAASDADVIVFCGVYFMAESAKILAPEKIVLLPKIDAGCPLADMAAPADVIEMKKKYPNAAVVTYINSSADVKAISDICCTSANAVKVVDSLKEDEIIFVPDRNLAAWVAKHTKKKIHHWNGFCPTHERLRVEDIKEVREKHPDAPIIAHPECKPEVLELVDYVAGTSGMMKISREIKAGEIIIATEVGLIERLRREIPGKAFYPASEKMVCRNMKLTRLEDVRNSLLYLDPKIEVEEDIRVKAFRALERMISI